jgi:serine/threonine protein kinase/Tol biopolymer transport system component
VIEDRRRQIEEICDGALNQPAGERAAFLAAACGDDEALRREVEALLRHAQTADDLFATPLAAVSAGIFASGQTSFVGQEIGSYRVVASLGAGAMGEVYRARDVKLNREVAIKVLPRAFAADPERLARFKREAQVLASLNHPNIAHVYGFEEARPANGSEPLLVAFVMELVEGETLAGQLAKRLPAPGEALSIARQIAVALDAMHEKGLVHRDLKPANIKITPEGVVKVLDFGLAKAVIRDISRPTTAKTIGATRDGVIMGTVAYMSPEQARGEPVDKRTDIWAFGCVLFEMLSGHSPFAGAGAADTLASVLERQPDWAALPPALDPRIKRLIRRCLEKPLSRRLRDVGDAIVELDEISECSEDRLDVRKPIAKRAVVAAIVILGIAAGVGAWISRRGASQRILQEVRLEINAPSTRDLVSIAISSDGLWVAGVGDPAQNPRLWVRELRSETPRFLQGTEGASLPFWSPEGHSLAFFADNKLKRIDVEGGVAQALADAPNPQGGSWGADGTILYTPTQISPVMRVPAAGGEPRAVTRTQADQLGHLYPHLLPDGTHFLYTVNGAPERRGVYVGSLGDSATRRILPGAIAATLSSSGYLLFAIDGALFAQKFDPNRLEPVGERVRVADSIATDRTAVAGSPDGAAVSASIAGPIVYRARPAQDDHQLIWFDRSGNEVTRLGTPSAGGLAPSLSPDGRRIAVSRLMDGNRDIWVLDLDRNVFSRFTFDSAVELSPFWTPDGRSILFASNRRGILSIYQKSVAGGDEQPLLMTEQNVNTADISPDGRMMFFSRADPKTLRDLWAKRLGSADPPFPISRTPGQDLNGEFAPNGEWFAYQSSESGRYEVSVRKFSGDASAIQVSSEGGTQPRWRQDGRELFYLGLDRQLVAVPVAFSSDGQTVKVGAPSRLFQTRIGGSNTLQGEYLVAPDGQRFLLDTPIRDVTPPITVILNWHPPA